MAKLLYTLMHDTLFKMLFVKFPGLLKQLVADLLAIRVGSIGEFAIKNPEMPPEVMGGKFCRLDISMSVDGQRVNLEVQVEDEGNYPERVLYYWAREYSTALASGEDYSTLPRTIVLSIIGFDHFGCAEYLSEFKALEVTRHTPFSDRLRLLVFELGKLPEQIGAGDMRLLWLSLFKASTMEELARIEALGVPVMDKAISAFKSIVVSPEFREIERMREKAGHDEAQALLHATQKGRQEGRQEVMYAVAQKLLGISRPMDEIMLVTGLPRDELERLGTGTPRAGQGAGTPRAGPGA